MTARSALGRRLVLARVAAWEEAGVVDAGTAARIRAFEGAGAGSALPLALVLLGAFAVALGLAAIVSANWEDIPVRAKLGTHVAANLAGGVAAWRWWAAGRTARAEGALLLLSASTLLLIAHVGQSFQLQGDTTGLLGGWLLLVSPFTLLLARGALHRWLWTLGLLAWLLGIIGDNSAWLEERRVFWLSVTAAAAGLYALRALPAAVGPWRAHFAGLGQAALLALPTLMLAGFPDFGETTAREWQDAAVAAVGGAALALAARLAVAEDRGPAGRRWTLLLAAAPALAMVPFLTEGAGGGVLTAALFAGFWLLAGREALAAGRPGLWNLAVGLVAARAFVVFLDAAGGLMATGFGLVVGGLVVIALGAAARRFMVRGGTPA